MESSHRLDGRLILGVVALVCVLAFVRVASALADGSTGEQPAATTSAATSARSAPSPRFGPPQRVAPTSVPPATTSSATR